MSYKILEAYIKSLPNDRCAVCEEEIKPDAFYLDIIPRNTTLPRLKICKGCFIHEGIASSIYNAPIE